MEDTKSTESNATAEQEEGGQYLDASEDFPFYDCDNSKHSPSQSPSQHSNLTQFESSQRSPRETPSSAGLRRRRSLNLRSRGTDISFADSTITSLDQDADSAPNSVVSSRDFNQLVVDSVSGGVVLSKEEDKGEISTSASTGNHRSEESGRSVSSSRRENEQDDFGSLVFLANLVIKAVGFQLNLLISLVTFPIWLLYSSYMFVIDPFGVLKRARGYLMSKVLGLSNTILGAFTENLSNFLKENKSWLQLVLRCGWGLFWSVYVSILLVTLLVSAFVIGGLMMRSLVEEPFRLKQGLNFDYTRSSPVALVPISGCPNVHRGEKFEIGNVGRLRVIPPNHKLQATVELTLPESDYNRNLGMFQVRIELLSTNGKTIASTSHPCMLRFKSEPIRLLTTLFKAVPLLTGYVSESQSLKLPFKGFTEGDVPTACVKVIMEQRAVFGPGAGIPELYDGFVLLESELPFLKKVLWNWKTTIYVWVSMIVLTMEMFFALVCCRPLFFPRVRPPSAVRSDTNQPSHLIQR